MLYPLSYRHSRAGEESNLRRLDNV